MGRIGIPLVEVMVGALAYWLCVPAQTPGVIRPQCCGGGQWETIANFEPASAVLAGPPGREAYGLSRVPGKPRAWRFSVPLAGGPSAEQPYIQFTLPPSVDAVVEHIALNDDGPPAVTPGGLYSPGPPYSSPWDLGTFPGLPPGGGGTLDETPTLAVPEPAAWLLLMIGVGVLGAMLRRVRRAGRADSVSKSDFPAPTMRR
jgi:hypothetical protein